MLSINRNIESNMAYFHIDLWKSYPQFCLFIYFFPFYLEGKKTWMGKTPFSVCYIRKNKNWVTVRDKCPKINVHFKWHTFKKKNRTDGQTDAQTNERTDGQIILCPIKKIIWGHKKPWNALYAIFDKYSLMLSVNILARGSLS